MIGLSHERIWNAIDALASVNGFSASGLAKRAGLDPTSFNKSKRVAKDGRERWPSTESLAKILDATGSDLQTLLALVENPTRTGEARLSAHSTVPLIGFAQAGSGGFFDDAGFPIGQGWDEVDIPAATTEDVYALEISGDSMLPLYRNGDTIIVSPSASIRKGDRVVLKTREGEVLAKVLERQSSKRVDLQSLNPEHENRSFEPAQIEWMARILWASQ